jgi:hypothetical protein
MDHDATMTVSKTGTREHLEVPQRKGVRPMKRLIAMTVLAAAVAFASAAAAQIIDDLKITDHGTTASVVQVFGGEAVEIDYKYSGLGSQTVTITVSSSFSCTNNGGNNPPGQLSGSSGPISPENGQVTGTIVTNAASCPDHMEPNIGPLVTVTLTKADGSVTQFFYTV